MSRPITHTPLAHAAASGSHRALRRHDTFARRLVHGAGTASHGTLALLAVLNACGDNSPSSPVVRAVVPARSVSICHVSQMNAASIQVDSSTLETHLAHGDYILNLSVDPSHTAPTDGVHFASISSAVEAARIVRASHPPVAAATCPLSISVAAGTYQGSTTGSADPTRERFPIVLDFSGVILRGALRMSMDGSQRATGLGDGGGETTLVPAASDANDAVDGSAPLIVVNSHPGGLSTVNVTVEGFVFQSGRAGAGATPRGQGVMALRVRDLTIRGNRFESGFRESLDLRASSALVERNHLANGRAGGRCDICLAGPGTYLALGNRLLASDAAGILVTPAALLPVPASVEPYLMPGEATVEATLANNDVREHGGTSANGAIHLGAVGIGASNVHGQVSARLTGNSLVHNAFGLVVDGGYTEFGSAPTGDISATLTGNQFTGSCERDLLVAMSRRTTALGLANAPYLRQSTFRLALNGDLRWDDAWYSNPEGYGNALVVNGTPVPSGVRQAYDPARGCSQ